MFNGLQHNTCGETTETCIVCGMVANIDPWLHAERYGHEPQVRRNGVELIHDGVGRFIPVSDRDN